MTVMQKAALCTMIGLSVYVIICITVNGMSFNDFLIAEAIPISKHDTLGKYNTYYKLSEKNSNDSTEDSIDDTDISIDKALLAVSDVNDVNIESVVNVTTNEDSVTPAPDAGDTVIAGLIGLGDVEFQPEPVLTDAEAGTKTVLTVKDLEKLRDLEYMRKYFYVVNSSTEMRPTDFDADRFVNADLQLSRSTPGPKVLVFHTHSTEGYADSDRDNYKDGVYSIGEELCKVLQDKYGIETLHDDGRYDMVDGRSQIMGAYERMEGPIKSLLKANPSIELVIDLHRDGVPENRRLVVEENGVNMAQLMFVNGLTLLKGKDGEAKRIDSLPNPFLDTNLALSFRMQLAANEMYPNLTRKVYLNAYRYSLHMMPKSLLVEVGAQTNTKQEAKNAVGALADILASVVN